MSRTHQPTAREVRTLAAPLSTSGVVTRLTMSMAGEQHARITTTADQTAAAALQLELPGIVMQFTSAGQVQHMLGFTCFATQASMDMVTTYPLPAAPDPVAHLRNIVTWISLPTGTVTREHMANPLRDRARGPYVPSQYKKPIPYLVLAFDPIILRILDHTALRSLITALERAHKTAIGVFPDGDQYRADPTKPTWKPHGRAYHRGAGWETIDVT